MLLAPLCPGFPDIHAFQARDKEDVDGRDVECEDALRTFARPLRLQNFSEAPMAAYAASAALAFSAIAWSAAGSWIARSDSTLRSTVMPDLDRPLINTL